MDLTNIPGRHGVLSQATTAAHLAGSTRKHLRRKKLSTTKGEAHGKFKYVTYCPINLCPLENMVHPESHPHAVVGLNTKHVTVRGITWTVR